MARARVGLVKEIEVVESEKVTLILSIVEAETLAFILSHVGGHPEFTARGHADTISAALKGVVSKPELYLGRYNQSLYIAQKGDTGAVRG